MTLCRIKYHFWGVFILGLILIVSGCATLQTKSQEDAAPTSASASAPSLPQEVKAKSALQILIGTWEEPGYTTHIIREKNGSPSVVSVYSAGGEDFEIMSVKWDGVKLSWTYRVPAGFIKKMATQLIQENTLRCSYFSPLGGPGTMELRRIE